MNKRYIVMIGGLISCYKIFSTREEAMELARELREQGKDPTILVDFCL